MKQFLLIILTTIISLSNIQASGDAIFVVQIGTFVNPQKTDFNKLNTLDFVYAEDFQGNVKNVMMGNYPTEAAANKMLQAAQGVGYSDAFITKRVLKPDNNKYFVQLAVKKYNEPIEWSKWAKAGKLYVQIVDKQLKLLAGPYDNREEALQGKALIREKGIKDAFPKQLNLTLVHPIGLFETLVPITAAKDLSSKGAKQKTTIEVKEDKKTTIVSNADKKKAPTKAVRKDFKRSSVAELQKALKRAYTYTGSIDGIYGKGTAKGIQAFESNNRRYQNYKILAAALPQKQHTPKTGSLESYIQMIGTNPEEAEHGLRLQVTPMASVYLAYIYLSKDNTGDNLAAANSLMNTAIKQIFVESDYEGNTDFDYRSTYSYSNIEQWLRHLGHLQAAATDAPALPCWIFERYPDTASEVFNDGIKAGKIKTADCSGFRSMASVRLLQLMVKDFDPRTEITENKAYNSTRTQLYLNPPLLEIKALSNLEDFNGWLWNGLNNWAKKDVLHEQMVQPLKVAYYRSFIDLENHFLDRGIPKKIARGLAINTLQTITEPSMKALLASKR